MRKVIFSTAAMFLVLIVMCSATSRSAYAQKVSGSAVTSTIADGTGFQIQSDGGEYTNSKTIQSIIQSGGDWVLDTNYSRYSLRKIYLDLSRGVGGSGPDGDDPVPPFQNQPVKARLITQCLTYGNSMLEMVNGNSIVCGLVIHFDYEGNSYRLAMNPLGPNRYTDTTAVSVSCDDGSGACTKWSIGSPYFSGCDPDTRHCVDDTNLTAIAKLVQVGVRGRTDKPLGNFNLSFAINASIP